MAAASGGGGLRLWRPAAALGQAARGVCSGRQAAAAAAAAAPRAEELAQRLRARKSEREKREVPKDPLRRRIRELASLSQQLQRVHPNVLAKALRRGVVYQDDEIVAINKPYGLPVHGGPGVKTCVADVLPILAEMLEKARARPLHLCHRLDKETTGVMVLARSKEAAEKIRFLFKTRQVEKVYWAISLGEPEPPEGLVEIPIVEKEVQSHQSHYKMTLAPNYRLAPEDGKAVKIRKNRNAESAVTRYRVLASSSACSLLELRPITGVKHQIRVHLAYGLGCPILGDHKYSHWSKLAPQKLPEIALKRLKLEQSKTRCLPLHLHALRLSLPAGAGGDERLEFACRPPRFFSDAALRLKLEVPKPGEEAG
ncbi:pseudouridylate synthase RPUSD4, mitochondrial [Apteryx mantelli]|uniref:Pseudouridylate synthase RPUSD4, mitochondrial n=1 Tax=Apteryx mantelli TaxID=2696672 RepID=A0ABM4FMZ3_9AVES